MIKSKDFKQLPYGYGRDKKFGYIFMSKRSLVLPEDYNDINNYMKIEESDGETFEQLACNLYARDKNYAYCFGQKIKESCGQSFEYIGSVYAKDKHAVYCRGNKINRADVETFNIMNDKSAYARDKNFIYYDDVESSGKAVILKNVDLKSFEVVGKYYARDKNNVYYGKRIIKNSDPKSFEAIGEIYAKDKNHLYSFGKTVKNADPKTFKILNHAYAKDSKTAYCNGGIIKGSDPKTFQCFNKGKETAGKYYDAEDKNNKYHVVWGGVEII